MCKTAVKEVSLYRNGCLVKRRGIVELINGKQTVVFENIPDSIDPSTVRLALPEGVTGTNIQTETLTAQQKQEATAEIRKKIARIDKSIEIKNAQIEMLNANADFSAKENVNMNDVVSYIVSLPNHLEGLYDEIEELNEKKKELTKQQQDLQKLTNCFRIRADITADKEGKCPVELRYYDRNRWWNPVYEIYTSEEEDKLSIKLKADIHQNSIENWEDVRMTLFTGNPQISGNIPQLYPQYLNFYEPRMYKTSARNAVMGAKVAMQAEMMVDEECEACEDTAEMPVMFDAVSNSRAVAVQNDTMMEYELDGLWTVTNENSTNADLQITEIPCRYHVVCVPKGDEFGYLAGEVKTTDIENILQTEASIYHKGTYLGNVFINADLTKDTYDISLGRDESVRVKREQKKKYTSSVLLKGQKKTEYEYQIKVTSAKNKVCRLTLIDQVPVSQDKTIVVERDNISGGSFDEKSGQVKWDFDLGPSETRTFDLSYSVAWPKDKSLNI